MAQRCVTAVHVAANGSSEVNVVPEATGDFVFEDNVGLFGLAIFSRGGFTIVSVR